MENNPNTSIEYRVKNGVVFVRGSADGGVTIGNINNGMVIGNIPEPYRPKNIVYVLGTIQNATGYELQANVRVDGDIFACVLHNSSTSNYWKFDICYPLEDNINL